MTARASGQPPETEPVAPQFTTPEAPRVSGLRPEILRQRRPGTTPVRLRRDGQRPLRFDGVPLVSRALDGPDSASGRQLELYLAADGRIAAGVQGRAATLTPGEARDVFAAAWIEDPADLDRLLTTTGFGRTDSTPPSPLEGSATPDHEPDAPALTRRKE